VALRAGRALIACALNSPITCWFPTSPRRRTVGKKFFDQGLPACHRPAASAISSYQKWVGAIRGQSLVLVAQVLEQFLAEVVSFSEEHPTWAAFAVEAEDAR
jgi:hypothetical protein